MTGLGNLIVTFIVVGIEIYIWLVLIRVVLSYFRPRTYHPVFRFIYEVTEPSLRLCRRFVPVVAGLDFSPLVLVVILEALRQLVVYLFSRVF